MKATGLLLSLLLLLALPVMGEDLEVWLKHSSGLVVGCNADNRACLISAGSSNAKKLKLRDAGNGCYLIVYTKGDNSELYMTLNGSWNTYFEANASTNNAKYSIEGNRNELFQLKCRANGGLLGSDSNDNGAFLYSDKSGSDPRYFFYIAASKTDPVPTQSQNYVLSPLARRQRNEGWGVSLCWWAGQCGKWSDSKINQLVDWLVSPNGLNYNIFRYNIGGGDDPKNAHCTLHHMGSGKGLRAEMEGFKDSSDGDYIWSRDEAQRKIMLKIREKRPDAIFEAFSNTPPYYMTYSGCCAGNSDGGKDNLRPEYYNEFAHYLVDVCRHYKDEYGIEFRTLEPFNESMSSYWHASGSQEGCHFDVASQIAFVKVLAPILKESGLATVISASDETNVGSQIAAFNSYRNDSRAFSSVGQWNTHTYGASNNERCRLGSLVHQRGSRLWMSETGAGGNGIGGNLSMAKRLIDDVRYIMPDAWVDWQFMEEANDQWCFVQGSFSGQTATRVKNYYVRRQFSAYIKQGYTFITTQSENTLAAINETGDTLVLVALNTAASPANHNVLLSDCVLDGEPTAIRTNSQLNCSVVRNACTVAGREVSFKLPAQSVTTFIFPIKPAACADPVPEMGRKYLIVPQGDPSLVLTAVSGSVKISATKFVESEDGSAVSRIDPSQVWTLRESSVKGKFNIVNGNGDVIRSSSSYALSTSRTSTSSSVYNFSATCVDGYFYKIVSANNLKAFDLENGSVSSSTVVGLYDYGNSVENIHRNWYFIPIEDCEGESGSPSAISQKPVVSREGECDSVGGMRLNAPQRGINLVRTSGGRAKKVLVL